MRAVVLGGEEGMRDCKYFLLISLPGGPACLAYIKLKNLSVSTCNYQLAHDLVYNMTPEHTSRS